MDKANKRKIYHMVKKCDIFKKCKDCLEIKQLCNYSVRLRKGDLIYYFLNCRLCRNEEMRKVMIRHNKKNSEDNEEKLKK